MGESTIKVDENRAAALEAAVSAGDAGSMQEAVEKAVDAWLTDRAFESLSDEALQKLWREGVESGEAAEIDFTALKAEARANARGT